MMGKQTHTVRKQTWNIISDIALSPNSLHVLEPNVYAVLSIVFFAGSNPVTLEQGNHGTYLITNYICFLFGHRVTRKQLLT